MDRVWQTDRIRERHDDYSVVSLQNNQWLFVPLVVTYLTKSTNKTMYNYCGKYNSCIT